MRAYIYDGESARIGISPERELVGSEVRLQPIAVGLCHSDVTLMQRPKSAHPFPLPLILGHEVAGRVIELGPKASGLDIGSDVVVHGARGCGHCRRCISGQENYCPWAREHGIWPYGLGRNGGLAEAMVVAHPNDLLPLDGLTPAQAAVMADAGLTAFHAIEPELSGIQPDDVVVVIGAGGLGHLAVQILNGLTAATIVVVDPRSQARALATRLGADYALEPENAPRHLAEIAGGAGAVRVWDFVGSDESVELTRATISTGGVIVMVGVGPGRLSVGVTAVPLGVSARTTYWGSKGELSKVLSMARLGQLEATTTAIALDDVPDAYRNLDTGHVTGRLVVTDFS